MPESVQPAQPFLFALGFGLLLVACEKIAIVGYDELPAGAPDASAGPEEEDAGVADAALPVRGPLSRLPWPSGVHAGNEASAYEAFSDFRGRAVDLATLYTDRNSWAGLVSPGWQFGAFESFRGQLVFSQPFFPLGMGSNAQCAQGMYDAEWRKFGKALIDNDRADSIIRLGWGPSDPRHEWHADADPSDYKTCYRRIVAAVKSTNPRVQFDFSFDPVRTSFPASGNPYDAYPGDDVVDIVGMDLFDRLPPTRTQAEWDAKCQGPLGLCTLFSFARAHGKKVAIGEWGVTRCGEQAGGDNPFFIEKMVALFRANADILAYEAYYHGDSDQVCAELTEESVPEARDVYQRTYRDL